MTRPENCPKITALICALNEAECLPHVLPKIPTWVDEVLLIDGHSTDKTFEIAQQLCPDIKLLRQPGHGKGDALRYGIEKATGEIIVTLDADGSTDPEEMVKFIAPLLQGSDFAKGTRFLGRHPQNKQWYRSLGNRVILKTFNLLFSESYTDLCSGFNAFWKSSITQISPWPADGYENEPFINCRAIKRGLKVVEVPHADSGRLYGEIKECALRQGPKAIKTILRERLRD